MWDLMYRIGMRKSDIWHLTKEEYFLLKALTFGKDVIPSGFMHPVGIGEYQTWIKDL